MALDLKRYSDETNVLAAAQARIAYLFDHFEKVYVSFSGGKDSTVLTHLVMAEAMKRGRRAGILVIDLEAQYQATVEHVREMLGRYHEHADCYWVCLPIILRNAVTQFEPRWCCWEPEARDAWVRELPDHPAVVSDPAVFPFFVPKMEFEEFVVLFGLWYGAGASTAACVGIRCDESLNRFRTIAVWDKRMYGGQRWTTHIGERVFNAYPIYDWQTRDLWIWHAQNPGRPHNPVYDLMHLAGLSIHQMRLCQPYGDDQKRGLWLYHLLEPQTWARVVARVNGANQGALYINENGNITGYYRIQRPPGHTWQSFCDLLMASLPEPTRQHYEAKFRVFLRGWKGRGYVNGIPDEAPKILEDKHWAPSWRRLCKVLLRNDWWCKGLGLTQPKSAAYEKYMALVRERRAGQRREESTRGQE